MHLARNRRCKIVISRSLADGGLDCFVWVGCAISFFLHNSLAQIPKAIFHSIENTSNSSSHIHAHCSVTFIFVVFFILGAGEELGWMGYAADPMQERRSALTTGIILGLVWAIWHFVPLIQMGRTLTWIAWWTLSTVALRILIVWLYNNTGKSVFAAIVFHATSNLSLAAFPMDYDYASVQFTLGTITATAAVIVSFLWGSKTLARFRYADLR